MESKLHRQTWLAYRTRFYKNQSHWPWRGSHTT